MNAFFLLLKKRFSNNFFSPKWSTLFLEISLGEVSSRSWTEKRYRKFHVKNVLYHFRDLHGGDVVLPIFPSPLPRLAEKVGEKTCKMWKVGKKFVETRREKLYQLRELTKVNLKLLRTQFCGQNVQFIRNFALLLFILILKTRAPKVMLFTP